MKSKLSLIAGIFIGGLLFSATSAFAVSTFIVGQGGTGVNTFTPSGLVGGNLTNPLYTISTTTVTCSGATSCTSFVIPGSTPITITSATSGSSPIATSTNEIANRLALWTSTSGTPATLGQVGAGTNGFVLALVGGVPTFVATSSINNGVTSIAVPQGTFNGALTFATTTNTTNGITSMLTITGSGSTLTFGSNQSGTLTVAGGGTGAATLTGCLTGNGTGAITGSGTCNTSNASVSSVASSHGIIGGTITTTGTLSLSSFIATSSAETANQIPVWTSTSGNGSGGSATLSGGFSGYTLTSTGLIATYASSTAQTISGELNIPHSGTVPTLSSGDIYSNTNSIASSSAVLGGSQNNTIFAVHSVPIVVASSTLSYFGAYGTSGTTTTAIANPLHSSTLTSYFCKTDVGTVYVGFGTGSATTTETQCTSTGTQVTVSSNNTWTGRQTVFMDIGHEASNPNIITITADVEDSN